MLVVFFKRIVRLAYVIAIFPGTIIEFSPNKTPVKSKLNGEHVNTPPQGFQTQALKIKEDY